MSRLAALLRRRLGLVAAFAYSGANFLISLTLQARAEPAEFGVFALLLVLVQFGMSLSNALFSAPLVVALAPEEAPRDAILRSHARVNLVLCLIGALAVGGLLRLFVSDPRVLGLAMALCLLAWMRWFLRAAELAERNFRAPARADLIYAGVVTLLTLALVLSDRISVPAALAVLCLGAGASLLVGTAGIVRRIWRARAATGASWRAAFKTHGAWALLGVVTTEAVANAHAYVIGFFMGPAVFAPVAAVQLFFRPVPILMQALTQYERPVLARQHAAGEIGAMRAAVRSMGRLIAATVLGNAALVAAILMLAQGLVGGGQYDAAVLWQIAGLVAAGQLVRAWRTGPSAALQAAGHYRPLALVTLIAAPVTLGAVGLAIMAGSGTPGILAALVAGELCATLLSNRRAAQLLRAPG